MLDNATTNLNKTENGSERWFGWFYVPSMITLTLVGLPTNILLLRILLGKRGICSNSRIFMLNLSMIHILFCTTMPIEFFCQWITHTLNRAVFVSWGFNQVGGPLLLCLQCVDRYLAVCHPLVYRRLKEPKLRLWLCFVVNVLTAGFCISLIFNGKHKWYLVFCVLVTVLVIMSTCNILVLRSLRQSGPGKREADPVKTRAFKTVLTVFLMVTTHYVLPLVEYFVRSFLSKSWPFLTSTAFILFSMSSFFQPWSYLILTKQLPKMLVCFCCKAETFPDTEGQM